MLLSAAKWDAAALPDDLMAQSSISAEVTVRLRLQRCRFQLPVRREARRASVYWSRGTHRRFLSERRRVGRAQCHVTEPTCCVSFS